MKRKRLERTPELSEFILLLTDCTKQPSVVATHRLFKPQLRRDLFNLKAKTEIKCKIQSFENKNELLCWIKGCFVQKWAGLNNIPTASKNMVNLYNKLRDSIFEACDKTELFSAEEVESIEYAFREEQEELIRFSEADTQSIEMGSIDMGSQDLLFIDWFDR